MKTIRLSADTNNGVYEGHDLHAIELNQEDFFDDLKKLLDGQSITSLVDLEMAERIAGLYGIY